MNYGYHRVSTKEQHIDRGIVEIENYAKTHGISLQKIYVDQHTGKEFYRPRYTVLKEDVLRRGDTLIITELDRLGRNKKGILDELQYFKEKGIRVMILEIPTTLMDLRVFNDKAFGANNMAQLMLEIINNLMIELYASLAQTEIEKKEKRQREGIQSMKMRGEWENYGRPAVMPLEEFAKQYQRVQENEIRPFELIKELGITKPTYYRYRKMVLEKGLISKK